MLEESNYPAKELEEMRLRNDLTSLRPIVPPPNIKRINGLPVISITQEIPLVNVGDSVQLVGPQMPTMSFSGIESTPPLSKIITTVIRVNSDYSFVTKDQNLTEVRVNLINGRYVPDDRSTINFVPR